MLVVKQNTPMPVRGRNPRTAQFQYATGAGGETAQIPGVSEMAIRGRVVGDDSHLVSLEIGSNPLMAAKNATAGKTAEAAERKRVQWVAAHR